jgi:carbon-monoxide dehydrogenase medium subunit
MFPSKFEYYAPTTVKEAVALLSEHPDAKVLAGGHSLLPAMKLRLANPEVLVDVGRIPGLNAIKAGADGMTIGALTTHAMVAASQEAALQCAALPEAAALIGDLQVRNRGTIGGSLAHADPGADYPAVMLALGAEMKAVGPKGERTIKADDFFTSLLTTALKPDEVLTEVRIPALPAHSGCAYVKFRNPASRYAMVGVCALVTLDDKGAVKQARVGITGACATASRAKTTEAALQGKKLDDATIASAAEQAAEGMDCLSDIHASADYRTHLVRVYTARALRAAAARAK